jgi:predicted GIY-YIG superfamily endonuclease
MDMITSTKERPSKPPRRSCVYLLLNTKGLTYIGVSYEPYKRLKSHNSAMKSKSRHYTNRNRPWVLAAVFYGLETRRQGLRAEYIMKHRAIRPGLVCSGMHEPPTGVQRRYMLMMATLDNLLCVDAIFHDVTKITCLLSDQAFPCDCTQRCIQRHYQHCVVTRLPV